MRQGKERTKIAVLGGGVGAMSAVFALTDPNNPTHRQYDITVYQMGWRLGGKGASGRNLDPAYHNRIEEHGLHIWFGFYDNAFRVMRQCYAELERPEGAPLARWDEAFRPYDQVTLTEYHQQRWTGRWLNWTAHFPRNQALPGDKSVYLSLNDYIATFLEGIHHAAEQSPEMSWGTKQMLFLLRQTARGLSKGSQQLPPTRRTTDKLLHRIGGLLRSVSNTELGHMSERSMLQLLTNAMQKHWQEIKGKVANNTEERRAWIILNLMYANLKGLLEDRLFVRGFDVINHLDYREWLKKYAIDDGGLMLASPGVNSVYDSVFAYENGDTHPPGSALYPPTANLEAGTALRAGLRQLMYEGAYMWKMQAGMGDVVFAPLYQVLKRRGVKFKFFHCVRDLQPSYDGYHIDKVTIGRQAYINPKREHPSPLRDDQKRALADNEYMPLLDVKGLPCWPSEPLYEQLLEGNLLKRRNIRLEDPDNGWHDVETIQLRRGRDFDKVLLGISLGALPSICSKLIKQSQDWQDMITHVKTVGTQACQLWLNQPAKSVGWEGPAHPLVSAFSVTPLNTWADMTYLVERETWNASPYPLHLAYFCGPFREDPADEDATEDDKREEVKDNVKELLNEHIHHLWPKATQGTRMTREFQWDLLIDTRHETERGARDPHGIQNDALSSQYVRVNVKGSERYVLSVKGSSKYRLPANSEAEFVNLYLAGDWTQNGLNLGCVEAATMSGLLASNAISHYPAKQDIVGLTFGASIEEIERIKAEGPAPMTPPPASRSPANGG